MSQNLGGLEKIRGEYNSLISLNTFSITIYVDNVDRYNKYSIIKGLGDLSTVNISSTRQQFQFLGDVDKLTCFVDVLTVIKPSGTPAADRNLPLLGWCWQAPSQAFFAGLH